MNKSESPPSWKKVVKKYTKVSNSRSWSQVSLNGLAYFAAWYLAYYSLDYSYIYTFALTVFIGILNIRLFIVMHDCGHGSLFKSKRVRTIVGYLAGLVNFTPYEQWRHSHAIHHTNSGNLDKRGSGGDIWTLTVDEYKKGSVFGRLWYRTYRFPIVLFLLGPIYIFQINYRFFSDIDKKKEKQSVIITNILLGVSIFLLGHFGGWKNTLTILVPATIISQSFGCWLFYIQHQFEDTYWKKSESWDYAEAALKGSSYLEAGKFFHWCTGNIGYHHIHHLNHLIPNYNLRKCFEGNDIFQKANKIGFGKSFKSAFLHLWDESQERLISFREYKKLYHS